MDGKKDLESNKDLTRLEQLVSQTDRRLKKARARARDVCGRLADEKSSPESGKEDGWRWAK